MTLRQLAGLASTAALTVVVGAAYGTASASGAEWSTTTPPAPLLATDAIDQSLLGGVLPSGSGLLGWQLGPLADLGGAAVGHLDAAGGLSRTAVFDGRRLVGLASDGHGRGIAVTAGTLDRSGTPPDYAPGLWWTALSGDGAAGPTRRLSTARIADAPRLAMNARGDAVATWLEHAGNRLRLRASLRRAGGQFRAPVTLASDAPIGDFEAGETAASVSDRGRVVVVHSGSAGLRAGRRQAPVFAWAGSVTRPLGLTAELRTAAEYARVAATFDGRERGYILSSGPSSRAPTRLAILVPGSRRFGAARTLSPATGLPSDLWTPKIAGMPQGGAMVLWPGSRPAGLYASRITSGGRLGRSQRLAKRGALPLALIAGHHGHTLAVWAGDGAPYANRAAQTGADGRFETSTETGLFGGATFWIDESGRAHGAALARDTSGVAELVVASAN
jgi:hypothetical protein